MVMLSSRRQLRSWAARVLALWLFGLGIGLANSCMAASVPVASARGDASASSVAAEARAQSAVRPSDHSHAHEINQGDQGNQGSYGGGQDKTNCQDFCDKVSISLAVTKSAITDLEQAPALPPAAAIFIAWPALARVPSWAPRPLGNLDPPARVAFAHLRL